MMTAVALQHDSLAPPAPAHVSGAELAEEERQLERQWVERALEGDARAFRSIVERHHHGMFRLAIRMLGDRTEAEDVVQEAFARAYRCLDHFDPSYRLSTWLYRIALNVCRDHLKSARRRERPDSFVAASTRARADETDRADLQLERAEMAERLRCALDRLSPAYREALVLKDLEDLSYQELRTITRTPITALKIRVLRARAKVRKLLEEEAS
jgi:RNA polymerase sigma-70 factor, ECF subfamily